MENELFAFGDLSPGSGFVKAFTTGESGSAYRSTRFRFPTRKAKPPSSAWRFALRLATL